MVKKLEDLLNRALREEEELQEIIEKAIKFIEDTEEYYLDGVNEELLDILKGRNK